jgi:hypothetical protein
MQNYAFCRIFARITGDESMLARLKSLPDDDPTDMPYRQVSENVHAHAERHAMLKKNIGREKVVHEIAEKDRGYFLAYEHIVEDYVEVGEFENCAKIFRTELEFFQMCRVNLQKFWTILWRLSK